MFVDDDDDDDPIQSRLLRKGLQVRRWSPNTTPCLTLTLTLTLLLYVDEYWDASTTGRARTLPHDDHDDDDDDDVACIINAEESTTRTRRSSLTSTMITLTIPGLMLLFQPTNQRTNLSMWK